MAAIEHDGHSYVCGACRSPLRARVMVPHELRLEGSQLVQDWDAGPTDMDQVVCSNCDNSLGTFHEANQTIRNADADRFIASVNVGA